MKELCVRSFEKFSQGVIKLSKVVLRSSVKKDYHERLLKGWDDTHMGFVVKCNGNTRIYKLLISPSIAGRSELSALITLLLSPRTWDLFHAIFRGLYISTSISVGNQPPFTINIKDLCCCRLPPWRIIYLHLNVRRQPAPLTISIKNLYRCRLPPYTVLICFANEQTFDIMTSFLI